VEWDWGGLRVQCIKRQEQFFLWSQNTELLTDKFPELHEFGKALPDGTVIEAQIVGWRGESTLAGDALQTRLRRKHLTKKLLRETPVRVFALDLLEDEGQDIRKQPFSQRRNRLSTLLTESPVSPTFHISPEVRTTCWTELDGIAGQAGRKGAAGLLLTPLETTEEGDESVKGWWSWKAKPFRLLGVLLYVQRQQGKSMTSVNEYSFAVWDGDQLVKVATTGGGLSEEEQEEIARFVKENTLERFGPVRSVKAELVFELSFDAIRKSARHKAGLKLDNPQITRWCREKSKRDVDSLAMLQGLLCEENTG
ncbi:MAG: ATP-dependent DNA ligase, partial [bacterium]|nr:ATP-dependent DNA ligase [bacterium]